MSAIPQLQMKLALEQRTTKRQEIEQFFSDNLGVKFSTRDMHWRFGTAFRTRVSDINKPDSKSRIVIRNEVIGHNDSRYWAEVKQ